MAVVFVPHYSPWVVSRWAFRLLMRRAESHLADAGDKYTLQQAVVLDGLHFDQVETEQANRLARAIGTAANELRVELRARPADPRDLELADMLAELEMHLSDFY